MVKEAIIDILYKCSRIYYSFKKYILSLVYINFANDYCKQYLDKENEMNTIFEEYIKNIKSLIKKLKMIVNVNDMNAVKKYQKNLIKTDYNKKFFEDLNYKVCKIRDKYSSSFFIGSSMYFYEFAEKYYNN